MKRRHKRRFEKKGRTISLTEDEYFWYRLFRDNGMLEKIEHGEKAAEEVIRREGRYDKGWTGTVKRWMRRYGIL